MKKTGLKFFFLKEKKPAQQLKIKSESKIMYKAILEIIEFQK